MTYVGKRSDRGVASGDGGSGDGADRRPHDEPGAAGGRLRRRVRACILLGNGNRVPDDAMETTT